MTATCFDCLPKAIFRLKTEDGFRKIVETCIFSLKMALGRQLKHVAVMIF